MRRTITHRSSRAAYADVAHTSVEALQLGRAGLPGLHEWAEVGCADERLVIGGRGYPPQEIEEIVGASHPALAPGHVAAFVAPTGEGEALVVACEVRERLPRTVRAADVAMAARATLAAELGLHATQVVLLRPFTLRKAAWGMTRRRTCRERFLDGTLRAAAWTDAHDARRRRPHVYAPRAD